MLRGSLALVVLAGCSQLFGLESPELREDSPDAAPLADGDAMTNPEGCVTLPLRDVDDDDGDSIGDLADNCIGITTAQIDSDGDGIGDACDEGSGKDARFCVWTFRNPDMDEDSAFWSTSWTTTPSWQIKDSRIEHTPSMQLDEASPLDARFSAPGGIAFDTRVTLGNYTPPMYFGEQLQTDNGIKYRCQLHQTANGGSLELARDGNAEQSVPVGNVPGMFRTYVRFAAVIENGKLRVHCSIASGLGTPITLERSYPLEPGPLRPALFADNVSVTYDHVTLYLLAI